MRRNEPRQFLEAFKAMELARGEGEKEPLKGLANAEMALGFINVDEFDMRPRAERVRIIMKSIGDALSPENPAWRRRWGTETESLCKTSSCPNKERSTHIVVRSPCTPVLAENLRDFLTKILPGTFEMHCRRCGGLFRTSVQTIERPMILIWNGYIKDAGLGSWNIGGKRITIAKALMGDEGAWGAALCPLTITPSSDTATREDKCREFLNWAHKKLGVQSSEFLQDVVSLYGCQDAGCMQGLGHQCKLRWSQTLPKHLDPLVKALGLEVDLLADWICKHEAPSIKEWCSQHPLDHKLGAKGNALHYPLSGRRMLIHFSANRLWQVHVVDRLREAIAESDQTTALIFGPTNWFGNHGLEMTRLANYPRDCRGPAGCYTPGIMTDVQRQIYEGPWSLWLAAKDPQTCMATDYKWSQFALLAKAHGAVLSEILECWLQLEKTAGKRNRETLEQNARDRATRSIAVEAGKLSVAQSLNESQKARKRIKVLLVQEIIRRRTAGYEGIDDLVEAAALHLPQERDRRSSRWAEEPPDANGADEPSDVLWQIKALNENAHHRIWVDDKWPDPNLIRQARGSPWFLTWDTETARRYVQTTKSKHITHSLLCCPSSNGIRFEATLSLTSPQPSPDFYIDVQARDYLLHLRPPAMKGKSTTAELLPWWRFLENRSLFQGDTTVLAGAISRREGDLRTAFLDKLWAGRERSPGADADAILDDRNADPVEGPWRPEQSPDLPDVTPPRHTEQVLKRPLRVEIGRKNDAASGQFSLKVKEALENGQDPLQALVSSARAMAAPPPATSALPRSSAHKDHRSRAKEARDKADRLSRLLSRFTQDLEQGMAPDTESQECRYAAKHSNDFLIALDTYRATNECLNDLGLRSGMTPLTVPQSGPQRSSVTDMCKALSGLITLLRYERVLETMVDLEKSRRKSILAAEEKWKTSRSAAYKEMTRPQEREATATLLEITEQVRDRGRLGKPGRSGELSNPTICLGPLFPPVESSAWKANDVLGSFERNMIINPDEEKLEDAIPHPAISSPQDLQDWRACQLPEGYDTWLESRGTRLVATEANEVVWPVTGLDYTRIAQLLVDEVCEKYVVGDYIAWSDGTLLFEFEDPRLIVPLNFEGLKADNLPIDLAIATDGSGDNAQAGSYYPAGTATIVLNRTIMYVALAGTDKGTSGQMELAAPAAGMRMAAGMETLGTTLIVSDYQPWVRADLARYEETGYRGLDSVTLWQENALRLRQILERNPDAVIFKTHVNSHQSGTLSWGQKMNEILDTLANLAKSLANSTEIMERGILLPMPYWRPPPPDQTYLVNNAAARLIGPVTPTELQAARESRQGKAFDANGLTSRLVRHAPEEFDLALAKCFNKEFYKGNMLALREDDLIIGTWRGIAKPDGGVRHLCSPDVIQNILSSVMASRLIQALMSLGSLDKAQKCNIPRISGTNDNNLLVMFALYDFHAAAFMKRLKHGAVRIILLSDISKAFDRAQLAPLLHALQVLLPGRDIQRLKATISSLYEKTRIAVTKRDKTVLIAKLAGVHQGDPASAILFAVLMELVRRLVPTNRRYKIRFYTAAGGTLYFRMEIDYADDQIRVTDDIEQMQNTINDLKRALASVGLTWNPKKVKALALMYSEQTGIRTFDPRLKTGEFDAQGNPTFIDVIGLDLSEPDSFKALGVFRDARIGTKDAGTAAMKSLQEKLTRMALSQYSLVAKLDTIKVCLSKAQEYLHFTAWISPRTLEDMDKLERKTIRTLYGALIPNAVIAGENHLSCRTWRQEVVAIAGIIRALGSSDARVKAAALALTGDAWEQYGGVEGELLSPRFFEWRDRDSNRNPVTLNLGSSSNPLDTPSRYAFLMNKWGVGLTIQDGALHITLDGHDVEKPYRILQILSERAHEDNMAVQVNRLSTDEAKNDGRNGHAGPAPRFSISWGLAGWDHKHRSELLAFSGPDSSFSTTEVRIIMMHRLLLWPTRFAAAIRTKGEVSARCHCGTAARPVIQTASHILNLPQSTRESTHSPELVALPHHRHNAALACVVETLFPGCTRAGEWTLVSADVQNKQGDPSAVGVRNAIENARIRGELGEAALDGQGDSPVAQHYKPDILMRRNKDGKILVLDLCYGSDDKLVFEDEVITAWYEEKVPNAPKTTSPDFWLGPLFKENGSMAEAGITKFGEDSAKVAIFKHARYMRRYARLATALRSYGSRNVQILPLAIGVGALIPNFTRRYLKFLLGEESVKLLLRNLTHLTQRYLVRAYRAYRQEPTDGLPRRNLRPGDER